MECPPRWPAAVDRGGAAAASSGAPLPKLEEGKEGGEQGDACGVISHRGKVGIGGNVGRARGRRRRRELELHREIQKLEGRVWLLFGVEECVMRVLLLVFFFVAESGLADVSGSAGTPTRGRCTVEQRKRARPEKQRDGACGSARLRGREKGREKWSRCGFLCAKERKEEAELLL